MTICKHAHVGSFGLLNCYTCVDGACVHKDSDNVCPFDVRNILSGHYVDAALDIVTANDVLCTKASDISKAKTMEDLNLTEEDFLASIKLA